MSDCTRFQKALRSGTATPGEKRHLFSCASCRAEARLGLAWKNLGRPSDLEARPLPDEVFIERVMRDVRGDRRRRSRLRAGLAAAATLLFFFLAGAARQLATTSPAGAEDEYAQLVGQSDSDTELETFLPE